MLFDRKGPGRQFSKWPVIRLEFANRLAARLCPQCSPNPIRAATAESRADSEVARVDVLGDVSYRAVSQKGLSSSGVITAGRKHTDGSVCIAVGIIDAGGSVRRSDCIERIDFWLAITPD